MSSPLKSPDSMLAIWLKAKFSFVKLPSPLKSPDSMLVIRLEDKSRTSATQPAEVARFDARDSVGGQIADSSSCLAR